MMTKNQLAKINFAVSAITFVAVLITYMLSMQISFPVAFMFVFFGGITVGSTISFCGIAVIKRCEGSFAAVFLVQVIMYFLMNIVAAVKVAVSDNGVTKVSLAGIAEILALVSLTALTILAVAVKKTVASKINITLFSLVCVAYLFLIVYVMFLHEGMTVYSVICDIIQYIQIVCASGYMAFLYREKRKNTNETV